jgi:hypothetical protein
VNLSLAERDILTIAEATGKGNSPLHNEQAFGITKEMNTDAFSSLFLLRQGAAPSFVKGLGRLIDFSPNLSRTALASDTQSIAEDWATVGRDLTQALTTFKSSKPLDHGRVPKRKPAKVHLKPATR